MSNTDKVITPANGHTITCVNSYGRSIPVADESFEGPLWVWSTNPYGGIEMLIRANSWESAYYLAIDESPTIPESELYEAYGFDSEAEYQVACISAELGVSEWPELSEGYQYQSNFKGTGVVNVGYEKLYPLTVECMRNLELSLTIGEE